MVATATIQVPNFSVALFYKIACNEHLWLFFIFILVLICHVCILTPLVTLFLPTFSCIVTIFVTVVTMHIALIRSLIRAAIFLCVLEVWLGGAGLLLTIWASSSRFSSTYASLTSSSVISSSSPTSHIYLCFEGLFLGKVCRPIFGIAHGFEVNPLTHQLIMLRGP